MSEYGSSRDLREMSLADIPGKYPVTKIRDKLMDETTVLGQHSCEADGLHTLARLIARRILTEQTREVIPQSPRKLKDKPPSKANQKDARMRGSLKG